MQSSNLQVIVGLGASGYSCVQFLRNQNLPVAIMDTRKDPPFLTQVRTAYPDVPLHLSGLDSKLLNEAAQIILSPGISVKTPEIAAQIKQGKPVIGDIELFAQAKSAPLIAITGTNAKSTVTTLVADMLKQAGLNVAVGGNLGTPALDLLMQNPKADVYVLELSSFQLETTHSLKAKVASVLNVTPDHMDRYVDLAEYQQAKCKIYHHCQIAVCNLDDPLTETERQPKFYFTLSNPKQNTFGRIIHHQHTYLAFEDQLLLDCQALPVLGTHYQANALAALAIGHGFGLKVQPMLQVLRTFQGLVHRCQFVRERHGVKWINDSKGTNVGATLAAIEGIGSELQGKIILIAGGIGKNADFSPLLPVFKKYVRSIILIGEAAEDIANIIKGDIPYSFAESMEAAIFAADRQAQRNDCVLLSPACASFDMFNNFEHRGEVFMQLVSELT